MQMSLLKPTRDEVIHHKKSFGDAIYLLRYFMPYRL